MKYRSWELYATNCMVMVKFPFNEHEVRQALAKGTVLKSLDLHGKRFNLMRYPV